MSNKGFVIFQPHRCMNIVNSSMMVSLYKDKMLNKRPNDFPVRVVFMEFK